VVGAPPLIDAAARAHQFLTFTTPPNLQRAVAAALALDDTYFSSLAKSQQGKRDRLAGGLVAAGFGVLDTAGTYFLVADYRPLDPDGHYADDGEFCSHLTRDAGVAAIPVSAFYGDDAPQGFIRFCFCKRDAVLDEAIERLRRYFVAAGS
jgi:aspartate/methionine/tyrosine aminotransferase